MIVTIENKGAIAPLATYDVGPEAVTNLDALHLAMQEATGKQLAHVVLDRAVEMAAEAIYDIDRTMKYGMTTPWEQLSPEMQKRWTRRVPSWFRASIAKAAQVVVSKEVQG